MFKLYRERRILHMWPFYRQKIISRTVFQYFLRPFSFNVSIKKRRIGFVILNTNKKVKSLGNNFVSRLVMCYCMTYYFTMRYIYICIHMSIYV